jgi:hypothetical protein
MEDDGSFAVHSHAGQIVNFTRQKAA